MTRLVRHIVLGRLSLVSGEDASNLRELLSLYDAFETPASRAAVESIQSIRSEPISIRTTERVSRGVRRGSRMTITIDEQVLSDGSLALLACVIDRLLTLRKSTGAFIETRFQSTLRPATLRIG